MTHYDPNDYEESKRRATEHRAEIDFARRARYVVWAGLGLVALIIAAYYHTTEAGERVRMYDTSNGNQKYTGYAERQSNGNYRFYDKRGEYTGRMTKDRLYSKDGSVQQKLYLIPNRK